MGGAATRGRKKAVTEEDEAAVVAAATHRDEMQACNTRVERLAAALTVAEEKQAAFDAEIRQAVTEVRFELRNMQQTHHRVSKLLQEKCQDMEKKNVACTSTVATLERNIEHLLDRVVSTDRSDTASHIGGTPDERWEEDEPRERSQDLQRSDIKFAAEDRLSDIEDMRTEVSSATSAPTGYCHSSLESARRTLSRGSPAVTVGAPCNGQ